MLHLCMARWCSREAPPTKVFCAKHLSMLPENMRRALSWRPSPEKTAAIEACVGAIAMREERPITAKERRLINSFVL